MGKRDIYYQAPIAILRRGRDSPKPNTIAVVKNIFRYSTWHYALKLREKHGLKGIRLLVDERCKAWGESRDFESIDDNELMFLASAYKLRISSSKTAWQDVREFYLSMGTGGTQFRIRRDYALDALRDEWPFLKFGTLCGLLGAVGDREAARVSTLMIQGLAAGYQSPADVPKGDLPSECAVRNWLDQLWQQNMFQFCKCGKFRWYSVRCPSDRALARVVSRLVENSTKKRVEKAQILAVKTAISDDPDNDPVRPVRP